MLAFAFQLTAARRRLGASFLPPAAANRGFNSQPPEGGWISASFNFSSCQAVSTHSRPKAAGRYSKCPLVSDNVSTHSRPKAAGEVTDAMCRQYVKFQLTAARRRLDLWLIGLPVSDRVSTHCRPKAAGYVFRSGLTACDMFQLTAARRRLVDRYTICAHARRFNSQPPEGGWLHPVYSA